MKCIGDKMSCKVSPDFACLISPTLKSIFKFFFFFNLLNLGLGRNGLSCLNPGNLDPSKKKLHQFFLHFKTI